jgi:hypothetical protein
LHIRLSSRNKYRYGFSNLLCDFRKKFPNVWMNMSETPEKKKTGLCYDNVLKTAWTGEWFDWTDFISKMQQNAPFKKAFCVCPSEKKSICSWFHHTIFTVFTTQILYPKCSRMHHFASFWKRPPPYHNNDVVEILIYLRNIFNFLTGYVI